MEYSFIKAGCVCVLLLYSLACKTEILILKNGEELSGETSYSEQGFGINSKVFMRDEVKRINFVRQGFKNVDKGIPIDGEHEDNRFVFKNSWICDRPESLINEADKLAEKYPDESIVYLRDCAKNILFPDGQRSYMYHGAYRILKHNMIRRTKSFTWNDERDHLKFMLFRIIQPDGSVKHVSSTDITVSSKKSSGSSSISSQGKTVTVSIPDVKVGSIIDYVYERHTHNPYKKDMFMPSFGFDSYGPVLLSSFEIIIPENHDLYWASRNMDGEDEPFQYQDSKGKHFCWEKRDCKPIIKETRMPAYFDIAKCIRASTDKKWDKYNAFRREMAVRNMVLTQLISEKTREVIKGAKNNREKLARIYHWVQEHIRYVSIKSGVASGLAGHPAEMTFKNKFGDCIDKAILMATMLKECGIESYPVSLMTKSGAEREVRIPSWGVNHAISVVYLEGKRLTLDSTSTNHRFPSYRSDDHGVWIHNYMKDEFYRSEVPVPEDNQYHRYQVFVVGNNETADVYYKTHYTGNRESSARSYWKRRRQDMWDKELKKMVSREFSGGRLVRYSINNARELSKPFSRELFFNIPHTFTKAGKYRIFETKLSRSFPETAMEDRRYPIKYFTSTQDKYEYLLNLPDSIKVHHLPEPVHLVNDYAEFHQEYRKTDKGFRFEQVYTRKKDFVPVKDFQMYKQFNEKVQDSYNSIVFLKRTDIK